MRDPLTHIDEASPTVIYIGVTGRGSADVDKVWSITRITIGTPTKIEKALATGGGVPIRDFEFQWTERTNYTYG